LPFKFPCVYPSDTPGHAGWHELRATNWQDAFTFYCGLFGWRKTEAIDMGAMDSYQLFASGSHAIGGMMSRSKDSPAFTGSSIGTSRTLMRPRRV
jgi:predicted enzyme related to lactoylglutathione lyase